MTEKKIISAREAGRILGIPAQKVRERMKSGAWDIGIVVKTGNGYRYDVMVDRLRGMIGSKEDD